MHRLTPLEVLAVALLLFAASVAGVTAFLTGGTASRVVLTPPPEARP